MSLELNDVKLLFIDLYYPCIRWMNCAHLPHSERHPSPNAEGLNLMTVLNAVIPLFFYLCESRGKKGWETYFTNLKISLLLCLST